MMSSWRLRRSLCGCARKLCSRTNARRQPTQPSKSRDAPAQVRKELERKGVPAHVPRPVQLRDDIRCGGELRSSRNGMEPLSDRPGCSKQHDPKNRLLQMGFHAEGYWKVDEC